ncbi:alpha/beta fold hydrolase [Corynebacterium sp. A21]|uniref:alpha/beta fold hydrolase n=1 Tax=Corynebacterium sp. A21 TaxID=3457318 RepID=UPI003FCF6CF3
MSGQCSVIRGVERAYSLTGPESGPPVLQLHGLGSSRRREDVSGTHATAAAEGLRVLRIDAPGHGPSSPVVAAADYTRQAMPSWWPTWCGKF